MIELRDVVKRYGNKTAVDGLNLTVGAGELFAFLGPNGAGKTTTIKMLVGLLRPTSGTIRIAGNDLATQGDAARAVLSYVPDQPYLYEKLTGREWLRLIARLYGVPDNRIAERIDAMIGAFELGTFIDDLTERYSHGMRQRAVFAGALIHEPKVLITDEPTVGLDPRSVRLLKDLLRAETKKGNTVFLSTHSLDIAQELADRIGIIDHGQLVAAGTFEEIRAGSAGNLEDLFLRMTSEKPA